MFLDLQIEYLLWLQNLREVTNGFFDPFLMAVTNFGSTIIPVAVITLIYWCLNRKVGEFLLLTASFCLLFNQLAKMLACINRPWILSDKIKPVPDAIPSAKGFSFPSGHTSNAMALWGGLAVLFWDNKKVRYTMIILILVIAFSRNFVGVHTPQDVLFSLAAGTVILLIMKKVFDKVISTVNFDSKVFVSGVVGVILVTATVIFKYYHLEGQKLVEYATQMPHVYYNLGYVFGLISGWYLCRKFIPYSTDNLHWVHRLLRYIPGLITTILLILFEVKALIPEMGACKGNFIGAVIIGIFITFIYPWVFTRIEKRFNLKGIENIWTKN